MVMVMRDMYGIYRWVTTCKCHYQYFLIFSLNCLEIYVALSLFKITSTDKSKTCRHILYERSRPTWTISHVVSQFYNYFSHNFYFKQSC